MMQFFPVEGFVLYGGSALAFEIRIARLSHTHSLSFEKKAEVAVYHQGWGQIWKKKQQLVW